MAIEETVLFHFKIILIRVVVFRSIVKIAIDKPTQSITATAIFICIYSFSM